MDPFPRRRGDPQVEAELRRRIRARGAIPFAEFMEVALYHPGGGYYEGHVEFGPRGDFVTSPETHPAFGALLARLTCRMWRALGQPPEFHVIEHGAGTGSLCRQLLSAAPACEPGFDAVLRYTIVETSAHLRARQQESLADFGPRLAWVSPGAAVRVPAGCVLANEVVDALPVHRVVLQAGVLREAQVALVDDRYSEVLGAPTAPELAAHLARLAVPLLEGQPLEICLAAGPWLRSAAAMLGTGYLLAIDYGGAGEELVRAAGPRGGLRCFSQHGWTDDPYDQPGLQDITAPVDFAELAWQAQASGLAVESEQSQRELLLGLGLRALATALTALDLPVTERQRNLRALSDLIGPAGLGRFRALLVRKCAPSLETAAADVEFTTGTPLLPAETQGW